MSKLKTVINRHGNREKFSFGAIQTRLEDLAENEFYGKRLDKICIAEVVQQIAQTSYNDISTSELDLQSCKVALDKYFEHEEYGKLAARVAINSHIKSVNILVGNDLITGTCNKLKNVLSNNCIKCFENHYDYFKTLMDERRNYRYSYRGFFILTNSSYLLRQLGTKTIVETPDFATLRCAVGIVAGTQLESFTDSELKLVTDIYLLLSSGVYTHATPTLLNSGTLFPQYASCFVIYMGDDLDSIGRGIHNSMMCQKYSGGIGMKWDLRCNGSVIKGTNGVANGLVPLAKVVDAISVYIDQGGGKRPGSISPYINCYNPDLLSVINLLNIRDIEIAQQHHRLFYAVWVSTYFMDCVYNDEMWYFISHDVAPELAHLYGDDFKNRYLELVQEKKYVSKMPARQVMDKIYFIQSVAGVPYIVSKDNVNNLRNQNAPINSLNLCAEVSVPSNDKEIGVCNLASVSVKKFVKSTQDHENAITNKLNGKKYYIDYKKLETTIRIIVRALNKTIDMGFYPVEECEYSNKLRRPIGIGIMGLADALAKFGFVFGSPEACEFRANFEEAMLYFAMDESRIMAVQFGAIANHDEYQSGQGMLHPILFKKYFKTRYEYKFDWHALADKIKQDGLYNSVFKCNMPTGSTANIMNNSACFEPYESNIYRYNAFAQELTVINKYLRRDLEYLGFTSDRFINAFVSESGRIQNIDFVKYSDLKNEDGLKYLMPETLEKIELLKKIYRVASFEVTPKEIIDMCLAAQPFVDQSQSMNLYFEKLSSTIFNWHYYGLKNGLKTLVYYTKTSSAVKENVCKNCVI